MKTFEEFQKDVQSNAELQAKLEAALKDVKTSEEKAAAIVKAAKENGYDVAVEDLSAQAAADQKMDAAEMELAGGLGQPDECGWDYKCQLVIHACDAAYQGIQPKLPH